MLRHLLSSTALIAALCIPATPTPQLDDPPLAMPAWLASSGQLGLNFGISVASAGDVNGDGYDDVIVGATSYDNGEEDEGAVFVYLGSAEGLAATPTWMAESNQSTSDFGGHVAGAGDVDGDGYDDVVVGASRWSNGNIREGAVFAWYGGPGGLGDDGTPENADWSIEGDEDWAGMGVVAGAGDVDGDGYDDVIVGAPAQTGDVLNEGFAYLFEGSELGLEPSAAWQRAGGSTFGSFAAAVACAGDVNGDDYDDVIIGAPGHLFTGVFPLEGWAYVWHGSETGLSPGNADWSAHGLQEQAYLGSSVGGRGDVDGDGYDDVIVGAPEYVVTPFGKAGAVFVWYGGSSGLGAPGTPLNAHWSALSDQSLSGWGDAVAIVPDIGRDGYDEILVGAHGYSAPQGTEGAAFMWFGKVGGLGPVDGMSNNADWRAEGNQPAAWFGNSVASAGDVNGDRMNDVIVGARFYNDLLDNDGRVFVFHGDNPWLDLQTGLAGGHGVPELLGIGTLQADTPIAVRLGDARENAVSYLVVGFEILGAPFMGGTLVPDLNPPGFFTTIFTDTNGRIDINATWPSGVTSGLELYLQYWIEDPNGPFGFSASNAAEATAP